MSYSWRPRPRPRPTRAFAARHRRRRRVDRVPRSSLDRPSIVAVRIVAIERVDRRLVAHANRRGVVALASASRRPRVRVSARVAPRVALRRRRRRRRRGFRRRRGARLEPQALFVGFHEHVGWLDVPASVVSSASAARAGVRGVAVARRGRRGARFSIARFERVDVCARATRARRRALLTRTRASVRVAVRVEATLRVAASTDGARAATHSRARRARRTRRASDARSRCREGEPRTARAREDGEG